jgi:glycosyltransferase involved in cell wall biosynthesis
MFLLGSLDAGGSERQTLEILRGLDRASFQPLLYTVYGKGGLQEQLPGDVVRCSYWDRFENPRLRFPGRILYRQARDLASVLASEQVDVLCDRNFHMTMLGALACRFRRTPRISVVSSDPTRDLPAGARGYLWLKRHFLRMAYRRAARVVAVSEGVREAVLRYYRLPADQVITIGNLFDLRRIDAMADAYAPPMQDGCFHVVSAGRLQAEKGTQILVEAAGRLISRGTADSLRLWILGDGPLAGQLEETIRRLRLEQRVFLVGHQANPLPYIKHADLFCLPSLYEGMPNALAEAMACGTPVLATDCPSGPYEMLRGGQFGGLVPPADPAALAEAIQSAIDNPAPWRARTQAARLHVEQHYGAEIGLSAYENAFRDAAEWKG